MEIWATVGLIALLGLNLSASIAVARSVSLGRGQKWTQLVIIWSVPVVGAIVIVGFLMTDRAQSWSSDAAESLAAGDITVLDQAPSPCGCSVPIADSD